MNRGGIVNRTLRPITVQPSVSCVAAFQFAPRNVGVSSDGGEAVRAKTAPLRQCIPHPPRRRLRELRPLTPAGSLERLTRFHPTRVWPCADRAACVLQAK